MRMIRLWAGKKSEMETEMERRDGRSDGRIG